MPEPRRLLEGPPPRAMGPTSGGLDLAELAGALEALDPMVVAQRGFYPLPDRTARVHYRMRSKEAAEARRQQEKEYRASLAGWTRARVEEEFRAHLAWRWTPQAAPVATPPAAEPVEAPAPVLVEGPPAPEVLSAPEVPEEVPPASAVPLEEAPGTPPAL